MVTPTTSINAATWYFAGAFGVAPPVAPPDFVGSIFGRKAAAPPPSI